MDGDRIVGREEEAVKLEVLMKKKAGIFFFFEGINR